MTSSNVPALEDGDRRGGVRQRVAIGAGWMLLVRFVDRAVGLISIAILARLLTPADFGLVALAMSLISILDTISELSVELVLIQKQTANRQHYDTAWTLNIIKGLVLAGVLLVLAAPAASFFSEPLVASVIYWLALSVAIGGLENIGVVDFRKQFEFHREFVYVTTARLSATSITIVLAFVSAGPWALVAGMVARRVISVLLSFRMHSYRPRLSLAMFWELFRFSKWLMVENLFTGVRWRWHSFVLGRLVGAQALGYYSMAYELAMMASSEIEAPIRRALFPGYAKAASDPARLRQAFLNAFGMITVLGAPVAVGIGLVADLVVPLLLGPKWLPVIPLVQVLSVVGLMVILSGGTRLVYLAADKPHLATLLSAVDTALLVPLALLGALKAGPIGVAWAMVIMATVSWLTAMAVVTRLLAIRARDILGRVWRILFALLGMIVAVRALHTNWKVEDSFAGMGVMLVLCVVLGATIYVGLLLALWRASGRPRGAEYDLLAAARATLQRVSVRGYRRAAPSNTSCRNDAPPVVLDPDEIGRGSR